MKKLLIRCIVFIHETLLIWTLFLVLVVQYHVSVRGLKVFPLENSVYLLFGIGCFTLILLFNRSCGASVERFLNRRSHLLLPLSLLCLLALQVYLCYGGYFRCDWDVAIVRDTVFHEINESYENILMEYFSRCPNNLMLVWVFEQVERLAALFGWAHPEFALVVFQCILDTVAVYLVYAIVLDLTHNQRMTWLAYGIAYVFIGLSPWVMLPYSDTTSIVVPVLLIRIYQKTALRQDGIRSAVGWFLIGLISIAAYKIKPQTLILTIAVVIMESVSFLTQRGKEELRCYLRNGCSLLVGAALFLGIYQIALVPSLHIVMEPEMAFGAQHYFMLGMNGTCDGWYSDEDAAFSKAFATRAERNQANLEEAVRRIRAFGPIGLARHLCRKQMLTYGDGTFSWAIDGVFFYEEVDWAHNQLSDAIDSFIRPEGKNYPFFLSSKQMIWVFLLTTLLFVPCYKREDLSERDDNTIAVMALAIIGLTVFELLFEARARYLFCYTPVYVILSVWGIRNLCVLLKEIKYFYAKGKKEYES